MQRDEFYIDEAGVRRLLEQQCADIAMRELSFRPSQGTDNLIFKLGRDMCVRLPVNLEASGKLEKEFKVLSELPRLPLQVPVPLHFGQPTDEFDGNWAVYYWLDGQSVDGLPEFDAQANVESLGECIRQLRASEVSSAPMSGVQSNYRGCGLSIRDELTCKAMANLSDLYRLDEMKRLWAMSLEVP